MPPPIKPVKYPLDLSGNNPANLIKNEMHSVSESHFRDYYFIVPLFSPFYIDNFEMYMLVGGNKRKLIEDVDYSFCLNYVAATRSTGKAVYGGLTLHNLDLNGILGITYQTVGGEHIADRLYVLQYFADKIYNPRTCIWDVITDVPKNFPPTPHYQDFDQFYGQEELVKALGEIRDAILQKAKTNAEIIGEVLDVLKTGILTDYVKKTGDEMRGLLRLMYEPVDGKDAVNKDYLEKVVDVAAGIPPGTVAARMAFEKSILDRLTLLELQTRNLARGDNVSQAYLSSVVDHKE